MLHNNNTKRGWTSCCIIFLYFVPSFLLVLIRGIGRKFIIPPYNYKMPFCMPSPACEKRTGEGSRKLKIQNWPGFSLPHSPGKLWAFSSIRRWMLLTIFFYVETADPIGKQRCTSEFSHLCQGEGGVGALVKILFFLQIFEFHCFVSVFLKRVTKLTLLSSGRVTDQVGGGRPYVLR